MKLDLQFTSCAMEDLQCDVAVGFVFQDRLEKGSALFGFDDITGENITRLYERGFITGGLGETLLLLSGETMKADKILLTGLGLFSDFSLTAFLEGIRGAAQNLKGLMVRDIGIQIPELSESVSDCSVFILKGCLYLVDALLWESNNGNDFQLRMIVSLGKNAVKGFETTVGHIKEYLNSKLDYTIVFDRTDLKSSPCADFA